MQTFLVRNKDVVVRRGATDLTLFPKGATEKRGRGGRPPDVVPEDFKWPPRSTLRFYRGDKLLISSNDRQFDLAYRLMGGSSPPEYKVTFGLTSQSTKAA